MESSSLEVPSAGTREDAIVFFRKLLEGARQRNCNALRPEQEANFLSAWRGGVEVIWNMTPIDWCAYGIVGILVYTEIQRTREVKKSLTRLTAVSFDPKQFLLTSLGDIQKPEV